MKKKLIIPAIVILVTLGGMAFANQPQPAKADDSPLTTQVDEQGKQLANHEARITNTESDVQDIQTKTNIAPSTNRIVVPNSATPVAPTAAPTAAQITSVTITSYRETPVGENTDCEYTYSDQTTYQFHWKVVTHGSAWVTDGSGQNGHSVPTTSTSTNGQCDSTIIGQTKP